MISLRKSYFCYKDIWRFIGNWDSFQKIFKDFTYHFLWRTGGEEIAFEIDKNVKSTKESEFEVHVLWNLLKNIFREIFQFPLFQETDTYMAVQNSIFLLTSIARERIIELKLTFDVNRRLLLGYIRRTVSPRRWVSGKLLPEFIGTKDFGNYESIESRDEEVWNKLH